MAAQRAWIQAKGLRETLSKGGLRPGRLCDSWRSAGIALTVAIFHFYRLGTIVGSSWRLREKRRYAAGRKLVIDQSFHPRGLGNSCFPVVRDKAETRRYMYSLKLSEESYLRRRNPGPRFLALRQGGSWGNCRLRRSVAVIRS